MRETTDLKRILIAGLLACGLLSPAFSQEGGIDAATEAELMMELEQKLPRKAPAQGAQPNLGKTVDWNVATQDLGSLLARAAGSRVEPHVLFHLGHALYNAGRIEEARATFEDLQTRFEDHPLVGISARPEEPSIVAQAIEDCTDELTWRAQHGVKSLPDPVIDEDLTVVLHFDAGDVGLRFYENAASEHRANFLKLAKEGYYDRTRVHRVVPGRFVQLGDPNTRSDDITSWGRGGPDRTLPSEFSLAKHERGTVTMFRAPGRNGSHGSQFQILLEEQPHLDFAQTPFAVVVDGLEVLEQVSTRSRNQHEAPLQDCFLNGISIREEKKGN